VSEWGSSLSTGPSPLTTFTAIEGVITMVWDLTGVLPRERGRGDIGTMVCGWNEGRGADYLRCR